jgi:hypothetical protein
MWWWVGWMDDGFSFVFAEHAKREKNMMQQKEREYREDDGAVPSVSWWSWCGCVAAEGDERG